MSDEPKQEPDRPESVVPLDGFLLIVVGCGFLFAIAGTFILIFIFGFHWPIAGLVGIVYGFPIGLAIGVAVWDYNSSLAQLSAAFALNSGANPHFSSRMRPHYLVGYFEGVVF